MAKLTTKQRHDNYTQAVKNREQEQLIGYWAKTQGFSHKALKNKDNQQLLQACKLATNIINTVKGEHKEVYKDCNNLLARYRQGKTIDQKLINLIYRHTRRIQRQQAKNTRKATR